MSKKATSSLLGILGLMSLLSATGCSTVAGPNFGMLNFPIPVSPYFQKEAEDRYWNHRRYERMPILGPITPGSPETALDPPSDDEVMRALEKAKPVQGGFAFPARDSTQQRANRGRAGRRLHRSPACDAAGRAGATPSRPLQVHRVLYGSHASRLADSVHQHGRGRPRGDLHRPRPSPHGRERGSGAGQQLLSFGQR